MAEMIHSPFLHLYKIGKNSNQDINSKRWGAINRETTGDFLIAKKAIKMKKLRKWQLAIRFPLTIQKGYLYFKSGNFFFGTTEFTS